MIKRLVKQNLYRVGEHIKPLIKKPKQKTTVLATVGTTIIVIAVLQIYKNALIINAPVNGEQGSSKNKSLSKNSHLKKNKSSHPYKQLSRRQFQINNFYLPIYHADNLESSKRPKTTLEREVKLDLTVQTSSIQSSLYLKKNFHFVQDQLLQKIRPLVPHFFLSSQEGKEIIKSKIKSVLNEIIFKKGYKANVEEVYLRSSMSG